MQTLGGCSEDVSATVTSHLRAEMVNQVDSAFKGAHCGIWGALPSSEPGGLGHFLGNAFWPRLEAPSFGPYQKYTPQDEMFMDREWLVGQGAFLTQDLNHVSWKDSLCKGAGRFSSFRRWQRSFPMSRLRLPFPASPPRHVPWILNIFCQVRVSSDYAFQSVAIFFMCVWFGAAVQTSPNLPWPVCFAKSNEGAAFSTKNWLISDSSVWT